MNQESQRPYVLSQDINYLLRNWEKSSGNTIPNPEEYQEKIIDGLKPIFPSLDVISERDLQDVAKETLLLSRKNNGVCISLDRAYMPAVAQNSSIFYLDASRQVDRSMESIGLGSRDSSGAIQDQLRTIAGKVGNRPVTIFDDVAFGGDTILDILSLAKQAKLNIGEITLGIATTDALARIGQAGYGCSARYEYLDLIDEICERDFFIGAPYSGRTYQENGKTYGFPYVFPLGKPEEWASIPENNALTFSLAMLALSRDFWSNTEKLSGRSISSSELAKPPYILGEQPSIVKALQSLIVNYQ